MPSEPFARMMSEVIGYLPHLLAGAVLCVVAWLAATALRAGATKASSLPSLSERPSAATGMAPMSQGVGHVLFWFVILPFLPGALDALRLEGVLGPVQDMFRQWLPMVPNPFGAALIGVVGHVVARVLRPHHQPAGSRRTGQGNRARRAGSLFAVVEAANQLGFTKVREVVTMSLRSAGNVLLGGAVLTIGY